MNATVKCAAHEIHRNAEFFYKFGGDKDAAIHALGHRKRSSQTGRARG